MSVGSLLREGDHFPLVNINQTITGWLTHADGVPLHHMRVDFFEDKTNKLIDSLRTNKEGMFRMQTNAQRTANKIRMEVIDQPWELQNHGQSSFPQQRIVHKQSIPITPDNEITLNDVPVEFWEYQNVGPYVGPLLRMPAIGSVKPQTSTWTYYYRLISRIIPSLARSFIPKHFPIKTKWVQYFFPTNLTMRVEKLSPGATRNPDWTGRRVLEGFAPVHLRKCKSMEHVKHVLKWGKYELDQEYNMPDVTTKFRCDFSKRQLVPVKIKIDQRNPLILPIKITSGSPLFKAALRVYRCGLTTYGQVNNHLRSHFITEQYAMAAFRHLRENPLKFLLLPHLRDVVLINFAGKGAIFGRTGALALCSALKETSVFAMLKECMGSDSYTDFKPRDPLFPENTYEFGSVANLYWKCLSEWVDVFFNKNEDKIKEQWIEIKRLSDDLVEHSFDYQKFENADYSEWVDTNEFDTSNEPRPVVNGREKAMRRITEVSENPCPKDLERLKQMCRHAIFFSTFYHAWSHNKQRDDLGELDYGPLGMSNLGMTDKEKETWLPKRMHAVKQLSMITTLVGFMHGFITRNENKDIQQDFIDVLKRHQREFEDAGISLDDFIRSCINI